MGKGRFRGSISGAHGEGLSEKFLQMELCEGSTRQCVGGGRIRY